MHFFRQTLSTAFAHSENKEKSIELAYMLKPFANSSIVESESTVRRPRQSFGPPELLI